MMVKIHIVVFWCDTMWVVNILEKYSASIFRELTWRWK